MSALTTDEPMDLDICIDWKEEANKILELLEKANKPLIKNYGHTINAALESRNIIYYILSSFVFSLNSNFTKTDGKVSYKGFLQKSDEDILGVLECLRLSTAREDTRVTLLSSIREQIDLIKGISLFVLTLKSFHLMYYNNCIETVD